MNHNTIGRINNYCNRKKIVIFKEQKFYIIKKINTKFYLLKKCRRNIKF